MDSFADLLPYLERARLAARSVIEGTGCELGASLLALELSRLGKPADFVRGHYLRPGEPETGHNEHAWVEVAAILLDPTRDQFDEDPSSETYEGRYVLCDRKPASEDLAYKQLGLQWRVPAVRERIRAVARQYGLDAREIEAYASRTYTMAVVGRS